MISDLHRTLASLERHTDAARLNEIMEHPDVRPHVWDAEGPIDMSAVVESPDNVVLIGEHGGMVFHYRMPGLYEAHTNVLPEGRGAWTLVFVRACLHWMFTRTPAVEISTRCPKGHVAAKALAKAIGGRYLFTRRDGWTINGQVVPAEIYNLMLTDWMNSAPGLTERGHWFHVKLSGEFARLGHTEEQHPDDLTHDRFFGAACEMILAGQAGKGCVFYNRFAIQAGYAPVRIEALTPLTINIRNALVIVRSDDFYVASILE